MQAQDYGNQVAELGETRGNGEGGQKFGGGGLIRIPAGAVRLHLWRRGLVQDRKALSILSIAH